MKCIQLEWRRRPQHALALAALLVLAACGQDKPQALVDGGKAAIAKADYKTAVIQLKTALQKEPESVSTRVLLGQALFGAEDYPGAAVEWAKALDQGADADAVVPDLARALLKAGEHKKLVALYANTTLKNPDRQALLKATVSSAWAALGDSAKSAAALDAALAASPDQPQVAMLRVRRLAIEQKLPEALAVIEKLLARDAKQPEAWVLKADLLGMMGQSADVSDAAFREALALDKANVPAHFSLINSMLRKPDLPAARKQAEAFKAALPTHPLNLFVEAQLAYADGNYTKARDLAQQLMRQSPNNVGILQLAAVIAAQSREWAQAETHYTKALQIDPALSSARRGLAQVYIALGQPTKSLQTLKPLLAGQGNEGREAETLSLAGEAELALGDAEAAETYFSRAAKIKPDDTAVKTALAMAHMSRGDTGTAFAELNSAAAASPSIIAELALYSARLKRREYDAALAAVDLIAKKQPKNAEVLGMRGRVYLARQDLVKARKAFEEQAKAEPTLFSAVSNLAALDVLERKPEAARKRLEAQIEADPKNVYALLMLAGLRAETGAPVDDVKKLLASAIQAAPQSPSPRMELIALTLRKRLYKEALVAAQEAAAAMPNDPYVMDAVGRAQMEAGDVEQAISTFRKLAGTDGKSGVAYTRLADIYKATGKREQAEVALRKALDIEPGMVQAQQALIDLLFASNRKADALELIKRMQRDTPNLPAGYSFEAAYQLKLNAVDAAVAAYRSGLAKTGNAALALELHRLYARAGRRDDADRFAAGWLKDHPKDAAFEYQMVETDIGRNDLEKAEVRLLRLQVDNPDNALALNNLAYVMLMRGRPGALVYAQKAAELAPESGRVLDTLATALVAEKLFDKALAAQKRAVERTPLDDPMHLRLAQIAIKAGDKTLARTELTRLQGLGTKFKAQDEVTRLLKNL